MSFDKGEHSAQVEGNKKVRRPKKDKKGLTNFLDKQPSKKTKGESATVAGDMVARRSSIVGDGPVVRTEGGSSLHRRSNTIESPTMPKEDDRRKRFARRASIGADSDVLKAPITPGDRRRRMQRRASVGGDCEVLKAPITPSDDKRKKFSRRASVGGDCDVLKPPITPKTPKENGEKKKRFARRASIGGEAEVLGKEPLMNNRRYSRRASMGGGVLPPPMPEEDLKEIQREIEELRIQMRRDEAYAWWGRLGRPTKKIFSKKCELMKDVDISPEDVDLLPWMPGEFVIDVTQVMKWTPNSEVKKRHSDLVERKSAAGRSLSEDYSPRSVADKKVQRSVTCPNLDDDDIILASPRKERNKTVNEVSERKERTSVKGKKPDKKGKTDKKEKKERKDSKDSSKAKASKAEPAKKPKKAKKALKSKEESDDEEDEIKDVEKKKKPKKKKKVEVEGGDDDKKKKKVKTKEAPTKRDSKKKKKPDLGGSCPILDAKGVDGEQSRTKSSKKKKKANLGGSCPVLHADIDDDEDGSKKSRRSTTTDDLPSRRKKKTVAQRSKSEDLSTPVTRRKKKKKSLDGKSGSSIKEESSNKEDLVPPSPRKAVPRSEFKSILSPAGVKQPRKLPKSGKSLNGPGLSAFLQNSKADDKNDAYDADDGTSVSGSVFTTSTFDLSVLYGKNPLMPPTEEQQVEEKIFPKAYQTPLTGKDFSTGKDFAAAPTESDVTGTPMNKKNKYKSLMTTPKKKRTTEEQARERNSNSEFSLSSRRKMLIEDNAAALSCSDTDTDSDSDSDSDDSDASSLGDYYCTEVEDSDDCSSGVSCCSDDENDDQSEAWVSFD